MKLIFCILLSSFSLCAMAQDNQNFLKGDIDASTLLIQSLCKPGVFNKSRSKGIEISYNYVNGAVFERNDNSYSFIPSLPSETKRIENFKFKVKFPVILKDNLTVIAGYEYKPTIFRFSTIGNYRPEGFSSINNSILKSNSFSLLITKPLSQKLYSSIQFKSSFNGDYSDFLSTSSKYSAYSIAGILGIKKDNFTELGVGLLFSQSVRKTAVIPFFMYNKTFNKNWGIEAVLPTKIMGRYNFDQNTIVLFGAEYKSLNYSVDINNGLSGSEEPFYYYNQSNISAQISLERKLVPWLWANVKIGYQKSLSSNFNALTNVGNSYSIEASNPLFFKVGIFVSPPDKFIK